jgi:hypothetical protein
MIKLSQQDDSNTRNAALAIMTAVNLAHVSAKLHTHENNLNNSKRVVETVLNNLKDINNPLVSGLYGFVTSHKLENYNFNKLLGYVEEKLITILDEYDTTFVQAGEKGLNYLAHELDDISDKIVNEIQSESGVNLSHILNTRKVLSGAAEGETIIPINREKDTAKIPNRISPKIKKDINDVSDPRDSLQSTLEYSPNNPIDAEKPDVIKSYEREIADLPEPERQKRLDRFKFAYLMKCAWLVCDMIKDGKIK